MLNKYLITIVKSCNAEISQATMHFASYPESFFCQQKNRLSTFSILKRVINDPLGQTHNPASSDHYFHMKIVVFCKILKSGEGWTDGQPEWK